MSPLNFFRAALLLSVGLHAGAQSVGDVEFVRGAGLAQQGPQPARILGQGLALQQGDHLSTAPDALAIVRLIDGTRMTLRPDSELVLQQVKWNESGAGSRLQLQLLRGGVRAQSGGIAKQSPDAATLQTALGSLKIRGTEFDVRLCQRDCAAQSATLHETPRPAALRASAKVALVQGPMNVVDAAGTSRHLVLGGSVYPGDTVVTGAATTAVLAFRDESRASLGPATRFRVDDFVFDKANQGEGRFLVSLLRGALRSLTGLIGKSNPRHVNYGAVTATIGIRGTGLDLDCSLDASCSFFTWLGRIAVTPLGQTEERALGAGEGLEVGAGEPRPLQRSTLEHLVRPDLVEIDFDALFGTSDIAPDEEGLYVWVRDGHIEMSGSSQSLHLGRGETGFIGVRGAALRAATQPLFLEFDASPLPASRNPGTRSLLFELGVRNVEQCKP